MSWTDERIALLKKMWKEGKSAAEIAKMLAKGVTRNAVIGKAHRMGLSGRPSPIKKPLPPKKEVAVKKGALPVLKDSKKSAAAPAVGLKNPALIKESEELKKLEKDAAKIGGGVALIDLSERMCKWPIGDPKEADFSFCGRTIRQGTPYCPEHAAMAYQTSSRSRGPSAAAIAANKNKEEAAEEVEEVVVADDDDADEEVVA